MQTRNFHLRKPNLNHFETYYLRLISPCSTNVLALFNLSYFEPVLMSNETTIEDFVDTRLVDFDWAINFVKHSVVSLILSQ